MEGYDGSDVFICLLENFLQLALNEKASSFKVFNCLNEEQIFDYLRNFFFSLICLDLDLPDSSDRVNFIDFTQLAPLLIGVIEDWGSVAKELKSLGRMSFFADTLIIPFLSDQLVD